MSAHPLQAYRRRIAATWICGLPLLCLAAWWAFRNPTVEVAPLPLDTLASGAESTPASDEPGTPAPKEMADAFALKPWSPPRSTPTPGATTPAPPRPAAPRIVASRLELLGIVQEGSIWKAAIYDPDADRVVVVGSGEHVGSRRVSSVTASSVELTGSSGVERLEIKKAGEEPSP